MILDFLNSLLGLNTPRTLPEWRGRATRFLIPSAKTRIGAEIEAHYTEAVQFHLANGFTEAEAQAAALAELGSAPAANRRFRQKYLTLFNVSELKTNLESDRSRRRIGCCFSFSLIFSLCMWVIQPPSANVPLWLLVTIWQLWWLAWLALAVRAYVLAGRPLTPPTLRQITGLRVVRHLLCCVGYLILFGGNRLEILRSPSDNPYMDLFQLTVPGFFVVQYAASSCYWLQVRQKLLVPGDDWNDLPPKNTAAA
jgi:hypothetical protein